MEGKINQANENRKCHMMHQPGTHQTPKYRPNPSSGFSPRTSRPPMNSPTYPNRGNPRAGGNHNNPGNASNFNRAPPKFNNNNAATNTNTAPKDWKQCCACCSKGQVASDLL